MGQKFSHSYRVIRCILADQFTHTVIQASFEAAAQEMFDVLRKTAMSPIIYEVLDVGTGITDAQGNLISSGAGIPSFVGVLDKSIHAILSNKEPVNGDIFIVNDPNFGGVTHLNDMIVAEPIFFQNELVAWAASIAHWGDIGGKTPGSMAADVTEIVAEGVRIPIVRLYSEGQRNPSIFDILRVNSRLPDFTIGDLAAQVSAGRRASSFIKNLYAKYGPAIIQEAIFDARTRAEKRARAGLASLPHGRFDISQPQDDGANWNVSVEISDEQFIVDLRHAPKEVKGPHNTSRDGAFIACQILFKCLTDPERFANAGSYAPLKVLTKPGTIFHASHQAAQGYYFETRVRLFDLLWHCLAKAMPDRLPAGHFASIFGTVIAGLHPDTGRPYAMVEPQMGGWGATTDRDGTGPLFSTSHGDTFCCPVEIAEARYGVDIISKSLSYPPSSDTEYTGGPGIRTEYQLRAAATLSSGLSHSQVPVWSLDGSSNGGVNSLSIQRKHGGQDTYQTVSGIQLEPQDRVTIQTAYGGSA